MVDAGINFVDGQLCGDVDFEMTEAKVQAITRCRESWYCNINGFAAQCYKGHAAAGRKINQIGEKAMEKRVLKTR